MKDQQWVSGSDAKISERSAVSFRLRHSCTVQMLKSLKDQQWVLGSDIPVVVIDGSKLAEAILVLMTVVSWAGL